MRKLFITTATQGIFSIVVIGLLVAPSLAYPVMLALGALHLHTSPAVPAWGWWTTYIVIMAGAMVLDTVRMLLGPEDT